MDLKFKTIGNLELASNEGKNALQLFPHDPTLLLEVGIIEVKVTYPRYNCVVLLRDFSL